MFRPALAGACVVFICALVAAGADRLQAQEASADPWDRSDLGRPILRLIGRSDGTVFAAAADAVFRAPPGGPWRPVSLPPPPGYDQAFAAGGAGNAPLFASGADGLYRSDDDGTTWAVAYPTADLVLAVAVSPADAGLVYVGLGTRPVTPDPSGSPLAPAPLVGDHFRLVRSRDRGAIWDTVEDLPDGNCQGSVMTLWPHPTDPTRLYRPVHCSPGNYVDDGLFLSIDQGAHWSRLPATIRSDTHRPAAIVGGVGTTPTRLYVLLDLNLTLPWYTGPLLRSDDDGATWVKMPTPSDVVGQAAETGTGRTPYGLASDPADPDRLFVGLTTFHSTRLWPEFAGTGADYAYSDGRVRFSADGGATWSDLDGPDLGKINDLLVSADGTTLLVATSQGVLRRPLP